ncbi:hypothetical protein [Tritonibacter mobilis]|uniref:hypothetical protein n=1 Tax=Tritonibacter mobilis TaxID=379347 RepID=UPI001CD9D85C|nr:hypothetical protein [Tritonibacter mobilis]MCA2007836.1 hypothetical protein [Tritonibacter mobilis]
MPHTSPLEEKMASVSLVADAAKEGELATEYIELASVMLQEGRIDEAATSLMAAQFHARPEMQKPIAQEVRRLVEMVPDRGGILTEHAQFLSMKKNILSIRQLFRWKRCPLVTQPAYSALIQ